jgi:hypothetical protein
MQHVPQRKRKNKEQQQQLQQQSSLNNIRRLSSYFALGISLVVVVRIVIGWRGESATNSIAVVDERVDKNSDSNNNTATAVADVVVDNVYFYCGASSLSPSILFKILIFDVFVACRQSVVAAPLSCGFASVLSFLVCCMSRAALHLHFHHHHHQSSLLLLMFYFIISDFVLNIFRFKIQKICWSRQRRDASDCWGIGSLWQRKSFKFKIFKTAIFKANAMGVGGLPAAPVGQRREGALEVTLQVSSSEK